MKHVHLRIRSRHETSVPHPLMMICFFSVSFGVFNAMHRLGNWVALRMTYGGRRVALEHLQVVQDKNTILVSNGSVISGWAAFADRVVMVGGWMVGSFVVGLLVLRLLPRDARGATSGGPVMGALGVLAIVVMIAELFTVAFWPLLRAEATVGVVVVVCVVAAWVERAWRGAPV
jgi:hypothetical protein